MSTPPGTKGSLSGLIVMPPADQVNPPTAEMDQVLAQPPSHAPTMGALDKVRYSHLDMIDYIISKGRVTNRELAARYGYTEGWISNVMASDAWQAAMEARREEIIDPALKMSIDERFRGLTTRSLERLMEKLDAPQVSDQVVLRAVELGARAMGVGGNAPPPAPSADHLAQLANRLIDLQANVRQRMTQGATYEGEIVPGQS